MRLLFQPLSDLTTNINADGIGRI